MSEIEIVPKEVLLEYHDEERIQEVNLPGFPFPTFVVEVPRERMAPNFGFAQMNVAHVREDLSPRVKRFVRDHELHHVKEYFMEGRGTNPRWFKGGVLGREIRANLVPGLKDPLGLMSCIWASATSRERLLFYLDRIKNNY